MIPPKRTTPTPPASQENKTKVLFSQVKKGTKGQRIVLYGTGGIGKTTLACLAPSPVALLDADESIDVLRAQLEEIGAPLPLIIPAVDWSSTRKMLQYGGWENIKSIAIDTVTKMEEWAAAYTLANVKHEKGHKVDSIEGYGFGKGYQFVFETFCGLLADLDRHVREGRNVILIAHECTSNVPNPRGEDWIRYEPRLQNPSSGKASIRARLKEWADHVLFLGYDVAVSKDGKAQGQGTRTLYANELPFCMGKSRTTSGQFDIPIGTSPWDSIIK